MLVMQHVQWCEVKCSLKFQTCHAKKSGRVWHHHHTKLVSMECMYSTVKNTPVWLRLNSPFAAYFGLHDILLWISTSYCGYQHLTVVIAAVDDDLAAIACADTQEID